MEEGTKATDDRCCDAITERIVRYNVDLCGVNVDMVGLVSLYLYDVLTGMYTWYNTWYL